MGYNFREELHNIQEVHDISVTNLNSKITYDFHIKFKNSPTYSSRSKDLLKSSIVTEGDRIIDLTIRLPPFSLDNDKLSLRNRIIEFFSKDDPDLVIRVSEGNESFIVHVEWPPTDKMGETLSFEESLQVIKKLIKMSQSSDI